MEKRVTSLEVTADFEAIIDRARASGATLVVERDGVASRDQRSFPKIPELKLELF